MKVIKPGNIKRAPWWTRVKAHCSHCGAIFQLNESDSPRVWDDQRDGPGAQIECPTCKERVSLYPNMGEHLYGG